MANVNGLVILNKPEGITSHTAVSIVRRLFGADKAGHTGTLDPMATGVLPVMLGRAVKASEYLTESDKHYIAVMRLGITTDTEDTTGTVLSESSDIPSHDRVLRAISSFVGDIRQVPPMYSAIRVGGKRLMELAREGKTVEREAREVTVYKIDAVMLSEREYSLDVVCSKGTYIRTLCADIGRLLGCGAAMAALCRAEAAGYSLDEAHSLDELRGMSEEALASVLIPMNEMLSDYPAVTLAPFFIHLTQNGLAVSLRKLGALPLSHEGERVRLLDKDGRLYALAEVQKDEAGDTVLRPIKHF